MEHKLLGWEYCYTTHVKLIHNLSAINTLFAHLVTSQGNQVNTMAADALAPWVARSSATLILSTQGNRVPVTSKKGFYLSVQSQHCHWEMIENEFFFFLKKIQHTHVISDIHIMRNMPYDPFCMKKTHHICSWIFLVLSYSCHCPFHWSQVSRREWRCSSSSYAC